MGINIAPATKESAARVLEMLSPADAGELLAAGVSDADMLAAVHEFGASVAEADAPLCLFGVRPHGDVGVPWMLSTNAMQKHGRALLRMAPHVVAEMRRTFPVLCNVVHANNEAAIRFVRRLGFVVHPSPVGPGRAFFMFSMGA